jgi:hypothetical protein
VSVGQASNSGNAARRGVVKMNRSIKSVWWVAIVLFVDCCAVGGRHPMDMILENNFMEHESQFEGLRAEIARDEGLEMINHDTVRYRGRTFSIKKDDTSDFADIERLGLRKERWVMYQNYLDDLRLMQISGCKEDYIEFRADKAKLTNGDSYKGYAYSVTPPKRQISSLDGYRISDSDKDNYGNYRVYKKIKGNWYLLLFVNG